MALRLVDRNRQIPNSLSFRIPGLKDWAPPRYASFNIIVTSAITVLKGNPHLVSKLGWDLSEAAMANRVDEYNAQLCKAMGWAEYFTESGSAGGAAAPVPFTPTVPPNPPSLLSRLGNVAVGADVVVQTLASKDQAVPSQLAEHRASICVQCPLNEKGDWLSFFTVPVSEAIRGAINTFTDWNLRTSKDADLGCCTACDCPMRLKVWFPISRIVGGLNQNQKDRLWGKCWIRSEGQL